MVEREFDLPAAPLEQALQRFSAQAGASAGIGGALPPIDTPAVRGRFTPLDALQRLLAGSELEAVQTGPRSFRLQPRGRDVVAAPVVAVPAALPELDEVLVTASKRAQPLWSLPLSVTVADGDVLSRAVPLGGSSVALQFDAATSSTHLGPGRDRQFIRGVADSPFIGPSQATVSVQFDETRLNYSAPDPDLRLLDVERVEVLKGPQGPLYGTGALGGVFHIVPQRPQLDAGSLGTRLHLGTTAGADATFGGSAVLNLPLAPQRLALRAVLYAADESGWIDNTGGRADANDTQVRGARLALRGVGEGGATLDLQAAAQFATTRDSQYVTLPGQYVRSGILPEPRDNDLLLGSATLRLPLARAELLVSASHVSHEVSGIEDASAAATAFGVPPPARYHEDRQYRLWGSEVRLSSLPGEGLSWLLGAAWLSADSRNTGTLDPAPAGGATLLDLSQDTSELALFGEAAWPLSAGFRATAGLRVARVRDEDERRDAAADLETSTLHTVTPSVAMDWHSADRRRFVFLRFAQAVRPGGLNADGAASGATRFRSDELSNVDLGLRLRQGPATLESTLFATRWQHVQSDYLLPDGLVGTRNVGRVQNHGLETQLRREWDRGYAVTLGLLLQKARLEQATVPVARDDARLPVVPDVRASLQLSRDFSWRGWRLGAELRGDYTGASRLSFDAQLDRRTPDQVTVGGALRLARGADAWQLTATNLLGARADTFAFGNPFSIRSAPQFTPLRPRTLLLQWQRDW